MRDQKLEGLIAKHSDSAYISGERSGAWLKMRINQGQEFVIGGYTPTAKNFDALVIGYYDGDNLIYVARTRNGFTSTLRANIFREFSGLRIYIAHLQTCQSRERAALDKALRHQT